MTSSFRSCSVLVPSKAFCKSLFGRCYGLRGLTGKTTTLATTFARVLSLCSLTLEARMSQASPTYFSNILLCIYTQYMCFDSWWGRPGRVTGQRLHVQHVGGALYLCRHQHRGRRRRAVDARSSRGAHAAGDAAVGDRCAEEGRPLGGHWGLMWSSWWGRSNKCK